MKTFLAIATAGLVALTLTAAFAPAASAGPAPRAATPVVASGFTNPNAPAPTELSDGCEEVNSSPPSYWAAFIGIGFNAGEVVSVTFTNPEDGATTGYLKINSITRDLTSIPGTASWVVRNTDTYEVYREYDTGTSDWTWSCGVTAAPQDHCTNGTWEVLGYKNQGQCIATMQANEHAGKVPPQ